MAKKETSNPSASQRSRYRRMRSREQKRSRRNKYIAVVAAVAAVAACGCYYVFGGEAPQQTDTLATGQQYTALIQRGTLYTFGSNDFGQLGLGDTTENTAQPTAAVQQNVVKVACGFNTTYAITEDGTLFGWGANEYAQLGNGSTEASAEPVKILDDVVDVAAGSGHALAVTSDGGVYAWGSNQCNAVGKGKSDSRSATEDAVKCQSTPVRIMEHGLSVSAGNQTSFVLTDDHSLYAWGLDQYDQVGLAPDKELKTDYYTVGYVSEPTKLLDNVAEVSAGRHLSGLALLQDGTVYAWGNNQFGAVGCSEDQQDKDGLVSEPVPVLDDCAAIACGNGHSLAIKTNGDLYAWGSNDNRQLGLGAVDHPDTEHPYQSTPAKVRGGVAEVASNGMHTVIRTRHGSLITFGCNSLGQCGNGTFDAAVEEAKLAIVG